MTATPGVAPQVVLDELPLELDNRYYFVVMAGDAEYLSVQVMSDGVTVVDVSPPTVELNLSTAIIRPEGNPATAWVGVHALDQVCLRGGDISVFNSSDEVVTVLSEWTTDTREYNRTMIPWNGVDADGARVADGLYRVVARAWDCQYERDPANHLSTDVEWVSVCPQTCAFAHATGTCVDGVCVMGACDVGWTDCLQDVDGCESSLTIHDRCGGCDTACGVYEQCINRECKNVCVDADEDGQADSACGGSDCNDQDKNIYLGGTEVCNDVDDDCDDVIDNGFDLDGDGFNTCDTGMTRDCDDLDPNSYPNAVEICGDGIDQDCSGLDLACDCPDSDEDGQYASRCGGVDCDDTQSTVYVGANELCDQRDNDCDDEVDEGDACRVHGRVPSCGCRVEDASGSWCWFATMVVVIARRRRPTT